MAEHIFISYAREDELLARRLHTHLQSQKFALWMDIFNIAPGDDWNKEIDRGLQRSNIIVVLLTPNSVDSKQVTSEWMDVVEDENKTVIPLLLADCKVPRRLKIQNWIDCRQDFDAGINQLIEQIKKINEKHGRTHAQPKIEAKSLNSQSPQTVPISVSEKIRIMIADFDIGINHLVEQIKKISKKRERPPAQPKIETKSLSSKSLRKERMSISDKILVLVVDDENMVRKGLLALLAIFDDFEVVGDVNNGRSAVDFCRAECPDVVLMDMVMPVMDGIEATMLIREACLDTQVVALTSFSDEETVQNILKAGAIGYLMKNVSVDELANVIRRAYNKIPTLSAEATKALISAATRPPTIGHDLTEREIEVLALMVVGLNNREIGERLVVSSATIKNHVSNILSKLGIVSRTQAVALAVEHKLLDKNT